MPSPWPSDSSDAAKAAAAQAEFNEKKWVWVPDDRDGYVAGWVQDEDENDGDIVLATSSEVSILIFVVSISDAFLSDTKGSTWLIVENESA